MARPCRCRKIRNLQDYYDFSCAQSEGNEKVVLSIDEYETIRLIDLEKMTQEECAELMGVSRTTVMAIYDSARRKLAEMIVEGKVLHIASGTYELYSDRGDQIKEKGQEQMRIAVTYENGEIFQHFKRAEQFGIYDVENKEAVMKQVLSSDGVGHGALAGVLKNAGVDVLICGGIGMGARMALEEAGISLCPGAYGNTDEAVKAFLNGTLNFDPDSACDHHGHHEDHDCGEHDHSCGDHCCH